MDIKENIPDSLIKLIKSFRNNKNTSYYNYKSKISFERLYDLILMAAYQLKKTGFKRGDKLIFIASKNPECFPFIYACWLLGLTFCPVDISLPKKRIEKTFENLEADGVIADKEGIYKYKKYHAQNISDVYKRTTIIDDINCSQKIKIEEYENLDFKEDVAYIIFTSGSTGSPKGVQITQNNFTSFLTAFYPRYGGDETYNYLSIGPLFFDMTILDCFVPAMYGGSVYLLNPPYLPDLFLSLLKQYQINCFSAVPSTLDLLLGDVDLVQYKDNFSCLKSILLGAEVPNENFLSKITEIAPSIQIINAYGPTECSVCCFSCDIGSKNITDKNNLIPIGHSFDNVSYRLRSLDDQWLTKGEGILYIGGPQVMKGYINNDAENLTRFLYVDGERFYNTGDVIRVNDDGIAYFKGRLDHEVKINGYRIHLQDIKKNLDPLIKADAIQPIKITIEGKDIIVIVYVCSGATSIEDNLHKIKGSIPKYMQPSLYIRIEKIPYLSNGKVDIRNIQECVYETIDSLNIKKFNSLNPEVLAL